MKHAFASVLGLLAIAACGGGNGSDDTPACSNIWVDGGTLPADYAGCINDDDSIEAAVIIECDSGIGGFTTYRDSYYALLGDTIDAYSDSDDAGYIQAYEDCFTDKQ